MVGRLANFKATLRPHLRRRSSRPRSPRTDLDDLLAAMESEVHRRPRCTGRASPASRLRGGSGSRIPEVAHADDAAPAAQGYDGYEEEGPADYDPAPDIETIDVPEMAVAVADDLDIPELAYEQDEPAAPAYDDLDADYAQGIRRARYARGACEPVAARR